MQPHTPSPLQALAHVVAFLPPIPPSQLLPLLEALEARLAMDAPLLTPHDLSRLAGALAAMGRQQQQQQQQQQQPAAKAGAGAGAGGLIQGPLLRLMAEIVRRHPQSFPPRDLVAVADALASLATGNATVRAGVAGAISGRLSELPPDDLATVARTLGAWAEAHVKQPPQQQREADESLMLELLVCAEARRGALGPRRTADILWCFGRHGFRNATAFMLRELPHIYGGADARLAPGSAEAYAAADMAKAVWAYATLLPRPAGRLPAAVFALAPEAPLAAPPSPMAAAAAAAAAAVATTGGNATEVPRPPPSQQAQQPQQPPERLVEQPQQHLLSALAGRAAVLVRHDLGSVDPPLLVAFAWALVTLGHRDGELLSAVGEALAPQLDALSLPEIAQLAWALTEGGLGGEGGPRTAFFDALALLVELHHRHFRLPDLALCLYALARRGYEGAGLRLFHHHHHQLGADVGDGEEAALASFLRANELQALHPSDAARLLWALARLRGGGEEGEAEAEAVVDAVAKDLSTKLPTLAGRDLGLAVDALARLAAASPPSEARGKLQAHLARHLPPWLEGFSSPDLAALLHDLLALNQPPAEAGLAEAAHALVERRLRRLLDQAERAEAAAGVGGEGAGAAVEGGNSSFFHLSRCQQLLGLWRRTGGAAAGTGAAGAE